MELTPVPSAVNTHLYHIYEKLHVHSAAGAVGNKMLERRDAGESGGSAE